MIEEDRKLFKLTFKDQRRIINKEITLLDLVVEKEEEIERLREENLLLRASEPMSKLQEDYGYKAEVERLHSIIKEVREYIEHENFKRNILLGFSEKKYTRDILNKVLEILDKENK